MKISQKIVFYEIFQVLKATTMTSVMYLQELKTKNTQVDKNMELGTKHVSQISTNKQTTRDD